MPYRIALLLLTALFPPVGFTEAAPAASAPAAAAEAAPAGDVAGVFPKRRDVDGNTVLMYEPQIRKWPNFDTFEAWVAIELIPADGSGTRYGTATFTGSTVVNLDARTVTITNPSFETILFTGPANDAYSKIVRRAIKRTEVDAPLDLFLSYLADDVLENPPPAGFNTAPPPIHVAKKPTILLFVNGEPVQIDSAGGLEIIANANWPTLYDPQSKAYFLLDDTFWLTSKQLKGTWKVTQKLPAAFDALAADQSQPSTFRDAIPPKPTTEKPPAVIFTEKPAELIVTTGDPLLEPITGAAGLFDVTNTESPLFKVEKNWYFLVAGRWFSTTNLDKGPWRYVTDLPKVFRDIPEDSPNGAILASVPGTVDSRMAALEALLPTKVSAARDSKPPVEVTYAGDPKFEPIQDTDVARAVNSGFDVLQYHNHYYWCYQGIWYDASAPTGPWAVTTEVPNAIYTIPPSSPAYNVTQVQVVESTPTTVTYSYPPAYTSSVYVVWGVPYYGTGWYYPPYIYGPVYYPYWGSYGHGSWYNPVTGGYGSRSVWYGPYGGYSYTQGYNPRTGRYGYVETAWDGDDWMSSGQKYNPRTGVTTSTERHYNADNQQLHTERVRERGDQWTTMDRSVDFANGSSEVRRQTSGGGSSQMNREFNDGTVTKDGTVTTGDGRTATISGERTIGEGGTTTISGSEGGKAVTKTNDGNRTTVAQSGSGDIYAGHNGNVYKKTDSGWQHYDGGNWNDVNTPERPNNGAGVDNGPADYSKQLDAARQQAQQRDTAAMNRSSGGFNSSRDMSQLNRDYSARQRGNQQFQQRRSMGSMGGGGRGMGAGRGGGGRRR
jgi:hypothetical protein